MGDRTTVTLTVLNEDVGTVKQLMEVDSVCEGCDTTYLTYYEVNYGELKFASTMQEKCIPYMIEWDRGSEYRAGVEFFMYTDTGEEKFHSYYEGDENPDIHQLLEFCDNPDNHAELAAFIRDYADKFKRPPWGIQREQSLIARAKQLIGA